jgi:DNA polymerase I
MAMDKTFLEYAALDPACTLEVRNGFWNELDKDGFRKAYDMTMALLPVLMFMQTRGVKISHKALGDTKTDVLQEAALKQKELNELVGYELNVNSSKQCQEYFYDRLNIAPYLNKDKKPTVDDMALQRLVRGTATRPGLKQAKLVQEIRGLQKLYGTYLDIQFDADNRMRGSYNPRGTKFGRLSSSKTVFGTGMNFQNLPPEFKKFIIPDDGYVFLNVDKRQAEWIAVAYLTNDANMITAIDKGIDVHTHTASEMFGVDADIVKYEHKLVGSETDQDRIKEIRMGDPSLSPHVGFNWPRSMSLRQAGKKSNHGLNYDEGFRGFALINEMDEKEAKRIVDLYHHIYPGIRLWYEAIKRELMENNRTLTNYFGRVVRFMGQWNDQLWKSAYSMKPQSTIVDSLNEGMVKIHQSDFLCGTEGMNIDVLAQVHDSILMQVPIYFIESLFNYTKIIEKITAYTSPDITYNSRTFKIASDYKVGFNWGDAHKERNPLGMTDCNSHEDVLKLLQGRKDYESRTQQLA